MADLHSRVSRIRAYIRLLLAERGSSRGNHRALLWPEDIGLEHTPEPMFGGVVALVRALIERVGEVRTRGGERRRLAMRRSPLSPPRDAAIIGGGDAQWAVKGSTWYYAGPAHASPQPAAPEPKPAAQAAATLPAPPPAEPVSDPMEAREAPLPGGHASPVALPSGVRRANFPRYIRRRGAATPVQGRAARFARQPGARPRMAGPGAGGTRCSIRCPGGHGRLMPQRDEVRRTDGSCRPYGRSHSPPPRGGRVARQQRRSLTGAFCRTPSRTTPANSYSARLRVERSTQ
jgi:hypothetical protein